MPRRRCCSPRGDISDAEILAFLDHSLRLFAETDVRHLAVAVHVLAGPEKPKLADHQASFTTLQSSHGLVNNCDSGNHTEHSSGLALFLWSGRFLGGVVIPISLLQLASQCPRYCGDALGSSANTRAKMTIQEILLQLTRAIQKFFHRPHEKRLSHAEVCKQRSLRPTSEKVIQFVSVMTSEILEMRSDPVDEMKLQLRDSHSAAITRRAGRRRLSARLVLSAVFSGEHHTEAENILHAKLACMTTASIYFDKLLMSRRQADSLPLGAPNHLYHPVVVCTLDMALSGPVVALAIFFQVFAH